MNPLPLTLRQNSSPIFKNYMQSKSSQWQNKTSSLYASFACLFFYVLIFKKQSLNFFENPLCRISSLIVFLTHNEAIVEKADFEKAPLCC